MSTTGRAGLPPDTHPSPHGDRVSRWTLAIGLWLAPAIWYIEMTLDTWFASRACFPRDEPLMVAQGPLASVFGICDGVALVVAIAAAVVAWRGWRRTRGERPGPGHKLIASGDGRARFMCMAGMLTSGMIAVAILYSTLVHQLMPACGT